MNKESYVLLPNTQINNRNNVFFFSFFYISILNYPELLILWCMFLFCFIEQNKLKPYSVAYENYT